MEWQTDDCTVRVEESNGFARSVHLRRRHQQRTVHPDCTFLTEDVTEFVVHELKVRVVINFGLRDTREKIVSQHGAGLQSC